MVKRFKVLGAGMPEIVVIIICFIKIIINKALDCTHRLTPCTLPPNANVMRVTPYTGLQIEVRRNFRSEFTGLACNLLDGRIIL